MSTAYVKRRSKIYRLFHPNKSKPPIPPIPPIPNNINIPTSPTTPIPTPIPNQLQNQNQNQTNNQKKSQFSKLKSVISKLVPKKLIIVNPKKTNLIKDKIKNNKETIKTIQKTNHIYIPQYQSILLNNIADIASDNDNDIDIDIDIDLSHSSNSTLEYKDNDLFPHPPLAPKSSSFMRSFDKRPEYVTYYAPAKLMAIFNNITVDENEQSVTVETKDGTHTRLDSVDQLFELASITIDYSNFYGYSKDDSEPTQTNDLSAISQGTEDLDIDNIDDIIDKTWQ